MPCYNKGQGLGGVGTGKISMLRINPTHPQFCCILGDFAMDEKVLFFVLRCQQIIPSL